MLRSYAIFIPLKYLPYSLHAAMPKGNWVTISLRPLLKDALEQAYQAKKVDLIKEDINTFNKWINERLIKGLAISELTSRFEIQLFEDEGERIYVKDRLTAKPWEIVIQEGHLFCVEEENTECVHTFFVREDRKLRAALEAKGIFFDQRDV